MVSDNGKQFDNPKFRDFRAELGIRNYYSSPTHPQSNGLPEVTNKTLKATFKTKLEDLKGKWVEYLPEVLWAYISTRKSATQETPFALAFGIECGPYPIHGPARLAFKWKENVKRKCGLIFEFWKIRPRGGTVLLWSRHLLLFLFLSGENQVRTKNLNDSSMEKSGLRKLDFWVRGLDYLSGRYFI